MQAKVYLSAMRILFVELLGGIGDVLIALAAIQALARSYSNAKLTVLTFAPGGTLLETDPYIAQVIYAQKGQAADMLRQLLLNHSFDLIISDTNYDDIDKIIQASDAPKVVTNLWRSPPAHQLVSDRFLEILLSEGLITQETIAPAQLYLSDRELQIARDKLADLTRPIAVLCPDAGMPIKRWSDQNFVALGKALQHQGASIVIPIGEDAEQATAIADAINARVWQPGTLRELAAMLAHASLMVAADTGPARIAAALNVPTITLFGPSWHGRYGQSLPHVNLQGYPACPDRKIENFTVQSCWYSGVCSQERTTCVDDISVQNVLDAIARLNLFT